MTSSKFRTFTTEAWAFTAIAGPIFMIADGLGFDGIALGVFAASIVIATAALLGTLALGIRSLIVN